MRNLSIQAQRAWKLPDSAGSLSATCLDLDENCLYAVTESSSNDKPLDVQVWKQISPEDPSFLFITSFESVIPPTSPRLARQVISAHVHAETRSLCVVTAGGDIAKIPLEDTDPAVDIVGSVDSGIFAAEWSPDDAYLVLVNGDAQMIQMTPFFDVLYESSLHTDDFGQDKQEALGWGSKATQFHGSLGKSAAAAPSPSSSVGGLSPDDDYLPRISFRGDAAHFCISSVKSSSSAPPRRVIRVYTLSPDLTLSSTVENTPGLEHALSWSSSGSLIASTQRYGARLPGLGAGREGRHDVVFFERNGLRRHSFELVAGLEPNLNKEVYPWGYAVRDVTWSSDSTALAVWIHTESDEDIVQIWTMGNYHWYLKQTVSVPSTKALKDVVWHPEQSLRLFLVTEDALVDYTFTWETCTSEARPPNDMGTVAVVDGEKLLVTPFRRQNVPPPMSSFEIPLGPARRGILPFASAPAHVSLSPTSDMVAVLYPDGTLEVWDVSKRIAKPNGDDEIRIIFSKKVSEEEPSVMSARQVVIWNDTNDVEAWSIAFIVSSAVSTSHGSQGSDHVYLLTSSTSHSSPVRVMLPSIGIGRLIHTAGYQASLWYQNGVGALYSIDIDQSVCVPSDYVFPTFCFQASALPPSSPSADPVFIGLSSSGKLHVVSPFLPLSVEPLASNVTSYTLTPTYIVYTTSSHEAYFIPIGAFNIDSQTSTSSYAALVTSSERRRVERGSLIVVAVPSTMSLVLQMPRGNLETICPRPFVLDIVKESISRKKYRKAFLACRKHRIDLNLMIDYDPASFLSGIETFIEQVHEVDHINLFLAGIGKSSQQPEQIAKICDAIRVHLEEKNIEKYVNSILTAHVVKTPPDLESGLALLTQLKENNPALVEDAVKYIIFLVDANVLFDTALGMYDFPLTLLIAQHSQRDPREYIPFLRELRALPTAYQHFRIDDHLKRYPKALIGLRDAGDDHFEEAIRYIEQHRLYIEALRVWKDRPVHHERLLEVYGDYLYERREFESAAQTFSLGSRWRKALLAHEKAHAWREAFALTSQAQLDEEEVKQLAERLAEDLIARKRFVEAARIILDYGDDIEAALSALVQGNDISEALRITTRASRPELVVSVIHPAALVLREEIGDEIEEAKEQLTKQSTRLDELAVKKLEEPDAFFMNEDSEALQNVEMMTDAGDSIAGTAFTRYTVAPSATSRGSKQTAKSRRKAARKKGRKGTVDEEEYILASIVKLVQRLEHLRTECAKLLPHLLLLSSNHRSEGAALQEHLRAFEKQLSGVIENVWAAEPSGTQPRGTIGADAGTTGTAERPKKPTIPAVSWEIKALDA